MRDRAPRRSRSSAMRSGRSTIGSDPAIVGRSVKRRHSDRRQIVGIAPPAFRFPPGAGANRTHPPDARACGRAGGTQVRWVFAVGRLESQHVRRSGVERTSPRVAGALELEHPSQNQGSEYFPVVARDVARRRYRTAAHLMLAAVAVVLLVACANVANLLLVARARPDARDGRAGRARGRAGSACRAAPRRERGPRDRRGRGGRRLRLLGSTCPGRARAASVTVPGLRDAGINCGVLAFALGVTAADGARLRAGRRHDDAARGRRRARHARPGRRRPGRPARRLRARRLRSRARHRPPRRRGPHRAQLCRLLAVDPGFRTDHVLTIDVALPADRYGKPEARQAFYDRALPALGQVTGIVRVGAAVVDAAHRQQLDGAVRARRPTRAGRRAAARRRVAAGVRRLLPRAAAFRCVAGRLFDRRDGPSAAGCRHHQRRRPTAILRDREPRRHARPPREGDGGDRRRRRRHPSRGADGPSRVRTCTSRSSTRPGWHHAVCPDGGDPPRHARALTSEPAARSSRDSCSPPPRRWPTIARESMGTTRLMLWLLGIFAAWRWRWPRSESTA